MGRVPTAVQHSSLVQPPFETTAWDPTNDGLWEHLSAIWNGGWVTHLPFETSFEFFS
jgi:hypothetical protein